jgi:hypothetical protein
MITAMVIRTLFNNMDWKEKCRNPYPECRLCFNSNLAIKSPKIEDKICSGDCWEHRIATKYYWGCPPKGKLFGSRAQIGMRVFLVFRQPTGGYTLWGKTTVRSIDRDVVHNDIEGEDGYSFIHFNPFEPLPRDKWVNNLRDIDLVNEKWLMGTFRYIDAYQEAKIENLIKNKQATSSPTTQDRCESIEDPIMNNSFIVNLSVSKIIKDRLEKACEYEGRTKEEIIREAIAEWLRQRDM